MALAGLAGFAVLLVALMLPLGWSDRLVLGVGLAVIGSPALAVWVYGPRGAYVLSAHAALAWVAVWALIAMKR